MSSFLQKDISKTWKAEIKELIFHPNLEYLRTHMLIFLLYGVLCGRTQNRSMHRAEFLRMYANEKFLEFVRPYAKKLRATIRYLCIYADE